MSNDKLANREIKKKKKKKKKCILWKFRYQIYCTRHFSRITFIKYAENRKIGKPNNLGNRFIRIVNIIFYISRSSLTKTINFFSQWVNSFSVTPGELSHFDEMRWWYLLGIILRSFLMLVNWKIVLRRHLDMYCFCVQGLLYVWNASISKFIVYELLPPSVFPTCNASI